MLLVKAFHESCGLVGVSEIVARIFAYIIQINDVKPAMIKF